MTKINKSATHQDRETARKLAPLLEAWYERCGRSFPWRSWHDEFRLAVTEILLQRTRAEVVTRFVERFLARYPNWRALSQVDASELERILRPLGLHRRRAVALRQLAAAALVGG